MTLLGGIQQKKYPELSLFLLFSLLLGLPMGQTQRSKGRGDINEFLKIIYLLKCERSAHTPPVGDSRPDEHYHELSTI